MTNDDERPNDERPNGERPNIISLPKKNGPGRWPNERPGWVDPDSAHEALRRGGYHKRGGLSRRELFFVEDNSKSTELFDAQRRAGYAEMMATVRKDRFAKDRVDVGDFHCNSVARLRYLGVLGDMPEIPVEYDFCTWMDVWVTAVIETDEAYLQFMNGLGIPVRKRVHVWLADGAATRPCEEEIERYRKLQKDARGNLLVIPVAIGDEVNLDFLAKLSVSESPRKIEAADLGKLFSWATGYEG